MSRPWRVQLVSVGRGTEMARSVVVEAAGAAGFECDVWDAPAFVMNPDLHTSAASVRAVYEHDIVIALADLHAGSTFAIDKVPPDMASELRALRVLPPAGNDELMPTLFQVEVLTAKALGRPTLVYIPDDLRDIVNQALAGLIEAPPAMLARPLARTVSPIESYITARDWQGLHSAYDVPSIKDVPFGHVLFLRRLMIETPNWCHSYRRNEAGRLRGLVQAGLRSVPLALSTHQPQRIASRMARQRDPLGRSSVADLFSAGQIVDPPYDLESGSLTGTGGLLPPHPGRSDVSIHETGRLVQSIRSGKNVLLLGDPGLGKSTCSLLVAHAASTSQGVASELIVFGTWRELDDVNMTGDVIVRKLIGSAVGRDYWPDQTDLPDASLRIILDGLDESPWTTETLRARLLELASLGSLLICCRASEFDRHLHTCVAAFDTIARLRPWGESELQTYVEVLRAAGNERAAAYVTEVLVALGSVDTVSILSFPLWLSMVSYLAEREGAISVGDLAQVAQSDYSLLLACGQAVAAEECRRHDVEGASEVVRLQRTWAEMAWVLHKALKRDSQLLAVPELLQRAGLTGDDPLRSAAESLVLEFNGRVVGFAHEVLLEFWLSQRILAALTSEPGRTDVVRDCLSLQRSLLTNRLIRHGIRRTDQAAKAADSLRSGYADLDQSDVFAKNQFLYLMGRIDDSCATRQFLRERWEDSSEFDFVRYSAAYASVIGGNIEVEESFYARLSNDLQFDRMNRGYHRYYYGDLSAREEDLPVYDDDIGPANGAIGQLLKRLRRNEDHHLRLRRIELLTLRRFLETRNLADHFHDELIDLSVALESGRRDDGKPGSVRLRDEINAIRRLLT